MSTVLWMILENDADDFAPDDLAALYASMDGLDEQCADLGVAAFNAVAGHRATDHAYGRGQGLAAALTDGIAQPAAGDGAHHRPCARLGLADGHGLRGADLLWHANLLNQRSAGDDAPHLLRHG